MNYRTLSLGLGWFSLALGAAELLASRRIARALDAEGYEGVIKGFGAREVAAGVGLLTRPESAPRMWNRVAGDAMDMAALGAVARGNRNPALLWGAVAFVAGAALVDTLAALGLSQDDADATLAAHPS